jgi:hypothetical protein
MTESEMLALMMVTPTSRQSATAVLWTVWPTMTQAVEVKQAQAVVVVGVAVVRVAGGVVAGTVVAGAVVAGVVGATGEV